MFNLFEHIYILTNEQNVSILLFNFFELFYCTLYTLMLYLHYLIKNEVINLLISNTSERLNYLMKTFNIKQIDILNKCTPLCERYNIKMGRNDISQYVSGKVKPKQDKLSILATALGVDEAWLIGYDVPMKKNNNTCSEIGNNLKHIRESKNISTEEIAMEFNISVEDVLNYENGLKEIPIEYLKMFATYFNVSVDELISFDVNNRRTVFITKDEKLSERYRKWQKAIGYDLELTDEEIDEIINFAKYVISKRKD